MKPLKNFKIGQVENIGRASMHIKSFAGHYGSCFQAVSKPLKVSRGFE